MIKIEKNMEMPKCARQCKYPWAEMQVGDSFFVKGVLIQRFSGAYGCAGSRYKMKFKGRTVKGGVRVWRIK